MNMQMLSALVAKDFSLYFRNRFFGFVTLLGLVAYVVIYYLLPDAVDETLVVGLVAPPLPAGIFGELEEAGMIFEPAANEDALLAAMEEGDYNVGLIMDEAVLSGLATGRQEDVILYFTPDFPDELRQAYVILFEELAYNLAGKPLAIDATEEVLGLDLSGNQIPLRDQMLPMMAVFILLVETMGLAALISGEIEARTINALLITPLTVGGLFVGKGIMGIGLAFTQAVLLMLVTGGLFQQPVLILVTLLLGAGLATGIGFLVASVAKDLMSVMAWGMLAIILLSIPAFTVLIPGLTSDWIRLLPSYYLIDTVFRAINFDVGWSDVLGNLVVLLLWTTGSFALGGWALRRKFQ